MQTGGGGTARYPIWLSLRGESAFNTKSLATAQVKSAMFIESGSIAKREGADVTFTPLVETSAQAGDIASMMLQFAQPDDVAKQITPSGKKAIAAMVTGKFKSAFPGGAPADAPPKEGEPPKKEEKKSDAPALTESKTTSTLFVIADTDWLFDDYSVRKSNFFGQVVAQPFNDNLALAANAVELLGGSQDLISIRGRSAARREFTVVRKMESEAQKQYQSKLTDLDTRLQDVQKKLTELQGKKGEGNRLIATPEMAKAIEDFQKQQATIRGERREIRLKLRESIDALENKLLALNMLSTPLLVLAFGLWFYRSRKN